MKTLAVILICSGSLGGAMWWLCLIRPFLRRHHDGYNTGANLLVAAWVDWQRCAEIAKEEGNRTARILQIGFLGLQLAFVVGGVLLLSRLHWP